MLAASLVGKVVPKSATLARALATMATPSRKAVLCCDLQYDILGFYSAEKQAELLASAQKVLDATRKHGHMPIYIRVAFEPNYHEVSSRNTFFSFVKSQGILKDGTKGTTIAAEIAPKEGELTLTKVRFGAFSTTKLRTILNANNITDIVLFGISTSGVILTTVREAADMDYSITVLGDACADRVPEVHDTLLKHVFPRQAAVKTVDEWIQSLSA